MRIILKIIAAPFVLALMLIVAVLSFLSCIPGVSPCWCWRSLFPPLGSRPSGFGCWIVCTGQNTPYRILW